MEQATDLEKAMSVSQFLDYKRRNKVSMPFLSVSPYYDLVFFEVLLAD